MILHLRTKQMLEDMARQGMTGKEALALATLYLHGARLVFERLYMNASREMSDPATTSEKASLEIASDFVTCAEAACLGIQMPLINACRGEELAALDAFISEFEENFYALETENFDG